MTKKMKMLPFAIFAIAMVSCNKPAGELIGVGDSGNFQEANPYGMVLIQGGAFQMGPNTQSAIFEEPDNLVHATVQSFWMDQTEITNSEYHQFINWVRDSIAMTKLVEAGRTEFANVPKGEDLNVEEYTLNWKRKIPWNDPEVKEALKDLYTPAGKFNNLNLRYSYTWLEINQAAALQNRFDVNKGKYEEGAFVIVDTSWIDEDNVIQDRTIRREVHGESDFISKKIICIYPDTLVWARDFQYSFDDPLVLKYFSHPGYLNYPVVGVTWEQAVAFCAWRTDYFNAHSIDGAQDYRLPTESEWEYASRGGKRMATYPWGNNYARSSDGCFLANFKPFRGSYNDDQGIITMKVGQYRPNDFGLYDMAGNVAEWTASSYQTTNNSTVHDLNPDIVYHAHYTDPDVFKRKVTKGGSWKDISYFLQCGVRSFEYQDRGRSYIGFRCVRSHIGD